MTMTNQIIKREQRIRLVSVLGILIAFIVVLSLNKEILISFLLAFVLTYLLDPVVTYLERLGLSRTKSIAIPFILIFSAITLISYSLTPIMAEQFSSFQENLQHYLVGIKELLSRWEQSLNRLFFNLYSLKMSDRLELYIENNITSLMQNIPSVASTILTTFLLAPIIAFFMLLDGRATMKRVLSFVPNNFFETALNLTNQINEQLGDFIRAKILESLFVASVVWIGLTLISFPYSIFLAIFAGVTNLIPYVGPIIGAIPAFVLAAINPELNSAIFLISGIYFSAQLIDLAFIIPIIVARTVNLHPVSVLVVIILGAKVMGVLGMLIAIPVASILKLTFKTLFNHLMHFRT